jgi:formate--tetrahydrofolate ligase
MIRDIREVGREIGIEAGDLIPYGLHFAKLRLDAEAAKKQQGKLILVTGMTPTAHGEGKTVTTIGLAQSIRALGHSAIATVRQPSMGPVFGLKGGATGGGKASVIPSELINLHFTGDFHAITSAHNLLSAMIDAHVYHGNELEIDTNRIEWPRTMDVNDRALRRVTVCEGKSNGQPHASQFVITAASEVMAIFALAGSYDDLRRRLSNIVIGFRRPGEAVRAAEIGAVGGMMVLLRDALMPNVAQTTDGTPAFIHAGPFANIAHGTASVLAQRAALERAEYVTNESGFGADLGAEKYFDIVMPQSGLKPAAAVLVATVRAIAAQGEGELRAGLANLGRHLDIVEGFGVQAVVAINRFPNDSEEDLAAVRDYCLARGVESGLSEVFERGAEGGMDLARKAMAAADAGRADPRAVYGAEMALEEKLATVARRVYGAEGVQIGEGAKAKLERLTELGFGHLAVCVAKTPMSFTADAKRLGAPVGWRLPITDAVVSAGAEFVVAIAGTTVRMPGLGKHPQALKMDLGPGGEMMGV